MSRISLGERTSVLGSASDMAHAAFEASVAETLLCRRLCVVSQAAYECRAAAIRFRRELRTSLVVDRFLVYRRFLLMHDSSSYAQGRCDD